MISLLVCRLSVNGLRSLSERGLTVRGLNRCGLRSRRSLRLGCGLGLISLRLGNHSGLGSGLGSRSGLVSGLGLRLIILRLGSRRSLSLGSRLFVHSGSLLCACADFTVLKLSSTIFTEHNK